MRSFRVASHLIFFGSFWLCEGYVDDVLSTYDTLHSCNLVTHHLKKRNVDLDGLYSTERVVSFSSFGRAFRLRLFRQEGLFSDNLFAAEVGENQTAEIYLSENEFYSGFIDGESRTLRTFAYWEDENLVATIKTRNDTFFVEPSWRHLPESENYTMIVYRLSDFKVAASQPTDDRVAFCSPPELNDTLSSSVNSVSMSDQSHARNLTGRRGRVKRSNGGQQQSQRTVCSVMLVADYRFFRSVGASSITSTAKYMIGVLSRVNSIYTKTEFGPNFSDLGFEIEGVLVYSASTPTSSVENSFNIEKTDWDTSELLNAFSSNKDWKNYCLVHLFTSTAFDNGVLGLAWVASDKAGSLGGICSPCSSGKCYNTGWSTSLNKFQNKLTTLEADLVAAHELGHGWGAQHDPDRSECSPSSSENGKFIMYPFSVSGMEPNNNKFSPCSQKSISSVLEVKKESCFESPRNSYCGNYKVEVGEQCDAGPTGRAGQDRCCDNQCQLRNGSSCSDSNADCCQNCTFAAPNTKFCWNSTDSSSCRANSYCTGNSAFCPEISVPDQTTCVNNGRCVNGSCLDVCEYSGLITCTCDSVENSCIWCCKEPSNDSCQPRNRINASYSPQNLPDGYPCKQGYCQAGKCQQSISTTTNRLWDLIQHLSVNQILLFMRNNLVLATIILTLIPYLIFCIAICYIDYKKQQKAQMRHDWLNKNNDQLTLDKTSSVVKKIEGIHNRRFYGH